MPRACLFPASSAWFGVMLPSPQAPLALRPVAFKAMGQDEFTPLAVGCLPDSPRGIPGAVSTTLCTPLSFSFLG